MSATVEQQPQHLMALQRANAVRLARAQLKRDVTAGVRTIRDVLAVHELLGIDTLEDVDPAAGTMTVVDLLTLPRRWGLTRARKLLSSIPVGEHVLVGALTSRQRRRIVAAFEGHLAETEAEARRKLERQQARERMAAAQAARLDRERAARAAVVPAAERVLDRPPVVLRAGLPAGLGVVCPDCRSEVGEACSYFDPVLDSWIEPPTHAARLRVERRIARTQPRPAPGAVRSRTPASTREET
jgi:hypothetical protein